MINFEIISWLSAHTHLYYVLSYESKTHTQKENGSTYCFTTVIFQNRALCNESGNLGKHLEQLCWTTVKA